MLARSLVSLASLVAVAAVIAACGAVPVAASAASPVTSAAAGATSRMDGPDDPAIAADADGAAAELAEKLRAVEIACTSGRPAFADACRDPAFATIVRRYQTRYAFRVDLHAEQGRVDALPRLGGYGVTDAEILKRIDGQCEDRCAVAERLDYGDARRSAVDECTKVDGKTNLAACAILRAKITADRDAASAAHAVADCERECTETAESARHDAEVERKRPKTRAESQRCRRSCLKGCDLSGWCGTCAMSCKFACATAADLVPRADPVGD